MQEGFDSYWARALKYFFLPCDPAGKINSSYNEEVYHSEAKFIYMDKMCVDASLGASQNIEQIEVPNFKKRLQQIK